MKRIIVLSLALAITGLLLVYFYLTFFEHKKKEDALKNLAESEMNFKQAKDVLDFSIKLLRADKYKRIDSDYIITVMGKPDLKFKDDRGDDIMAYHYSENKAEMFVFLILTNDELKKGQYFHREDIRKMYPQIDSQINGKSKQ